MSITMSVSSLCERCRLYQIWSLTCMYNPQRIKWNWLWEVWEINDNILSNTRFSQYEWWGDTLCTKNKSKDTHKLKAEIFNVNKLTISIQFTGYSRHQHLSLKTRNNFKHVCVNMWIIRSLVSWLWPFHSDGKTLNVYCLPAEPMFTKLYISLYAIIMSPHIIVNSQ